MRVHPVTGDREVIEPGAPPTCGNGVATGDEQCDDGNLIDCDGCSAACTLEGVCGDGVQAACEACDDNNAVDGDGCDSNCTTTGCGNGITTAGEACDDGAGNDMFCCSLSCQLVDTDGDHVCDRDDVCPSISDPGQANTDGDTFGDSCDPCPADADNDSDLDGFCVGASFNAPAIGGEDPCSRTGAAGDWLKPQVRFSRLLPPGGDEKMRIKGRFVMGSSQQKIHCEGSNPVPPGYRPGHRAGQQRELSDRPGSRAVDGGRRAEQPSAAARQHPGRRPVRRGDVPGRAARAEP